MKKKSYVKKQTGSEIIRRGFLAAVFLMMLLRDLYYDNLYVCVIYDVILFVGMLSCFHSIAGEFILNWQQRKKEREEKDTAL